MARKKTPTLADHVEAAERREAPRAQARVSGRGSGASAWIGLMVLTVLLTAGVVLFLRLKRYI